MLRNRFLQSIAVLLCLGFSSCEDSSIYPGPIPNPGVWGQMNAIRQHRKVISGTDTVNYSFEMAIAYFFEKAGQTSPYVNAGTVSINGITLAQQADNSYYVDASPGATIPTLDLDNNTHWVVTGTAPGAKIELNDGPMDPEYRDVLPYQISKSSGFYFVFDSTTVNNADSVRILIDDNSGNPMFQKIYSARAGEVFISPAELAGLQPTSSFTASLGVFVYSSRIVILRDKGYHFVKEKRYIQSLNIN